MKKLALTATLCASLIAVAPTQGYAGAASTTTSSGGSSSDAAAIVLIVALGALIFGLGNNGSRSKAPKKSADSQF